MAMFQCRPVEYYWLRFTHEIEGQCLDKAVITGATYASTAFNAWADWTLGLLPLALVWKLELGKRTKASVAGILALGILSVNSAFDYPQIILVDRIIGLRQLHLFEYHIYGN